MLKYTVVVTGVLASLVLCHLGEGVLVPLVFAAFLAQLLVPVVSLLERKIPRFAAILLAQIALGSVAVGLVGMIVDQLTVFQKDGPELQARALGVVTQVQQFAAQNLGVAREGQIEFLKNGLEGILGVGGHFAVVALSLVVTMAGHIALVSILIFMMLFYREHLRRTLSRLCRMEAGDSGALLVDRIAEVGQKYVAGLLTVIAAVGVLDTIGFALVQAPFPVLFGLLGALAVFVPYVGIIIVAPTCALLALVATGSVTVATSVLGVYTVVHFLEGNVITPALVGHQVNLNPLAAFLAVIIGGELWGPAGMLLFIPLVGMAGLVLETTKSGLPWAELIAGVPETLTRVSLRERLAALLRGRG